MNSNAVSVVPEELADSDIETLHAALAMEIAKHTEATAGARVGAGARDRLLARVHRSAQASRSFVTVRHDDTPWTAWIHGVRMRRLHGSGPIRTAIVELQAGALLPPPDLAAAQEILVLDGSLLGSATLEPQGFCLRSRGRPGTWTAPEGARLYVRELIGSREALPTAEADWWPKDDAQAVVVEGGAQGWQPFTPGVAVKPLFGDDAAISMLARFDPGARVATHGHRLDEDCIMIEGDLFLGDVLLRKGEYQLAPAGTEHQSLVSDHGAVLFFHGAVDAALRGRA